MLNRHFTFHMWDYLWCMLVLVLLIYRTWRPLVWDGSFSGNRTLLFLSGWSPLLHCYVDLVKGLISVTFRNELTFKNKGDDLLWTPEETVQVGTVVRGLCNVWKWLLLYHTTWIGILWQPPCFEKAHKIQR